MILCLGKQDHDGATQDCHRLAGMRDHIAMRLDRACTGCSARGDGMIEPEQSHLCSQVSVQWLATWQMALHCFNGHHSVAVHQIVVLAVWLRG